MIGFSSNLVPSPIVEISIILAPHPLVNDVCANKGLTAIWCVSVANKGLSRKCRGAACCALIRQRGTVHPRMGRVSPAFSERGTFHPTLSTLPNLSPRLCVEALSSLFGFSHVQKLHYNAVSSKTARFVCIIMQFLTFPPSAGARAHRLYVDCYRPFLSTDGSLRRGTNAS